jgi:ribosomal protein L11 methylase PrmA
MKSSNSLEIPSAGSSDSAESSSFRDPSGFLFTRHGSLYRQVNQTYRSDYDRLMESGLYSELAAAGRLVAHQAVDIPAEVPDLAYRVIQPERIPFISYPYEWSFSQLKDAALSTLAIQKAALEKGMSLKDASAYNIQFHGGRPILIDTLSFEGYREGEPWTAYRQFCQHFLAPLALMAYVDVRLSQLLRVYIDGIPLDLASKLLPRRTRMNLSLAAHIHLHAATQQRYSNKTVARADLQRRMSKVAFLGLIDNLESSVHRLSWKPAGTEWGEYYTDTNYTPAALEHKMKIVSSFLERINPSSLWDLGANTGLFSRLASERGIFTVAFDIDPAAVELNYRACLQSQEKNLVPLVMDFTNPSPSIGWHNRERHSLMGRAPVEAAMALALVHHLAISNNVPLPHLARFFAEITRWLIIEFVPKTDSQVQRLLATRADIFPDYQFGGFEKAFGIYFRIVESVDVQDSQRRVYLMERSA